MRINLKQQFKNLKGEPLKIGDTEEILTTGLAISNILISAPEKGKMKLYILAQKCANDKTIELDAADLNLIKNAIENTSVYSNALVLGQLEMFLAKEGKE